MSAEDGSSIAFARMQNEQVKNDLQSISGAPKIDAIEPQKPGPGLRDRWNFNRHGDPNARAEEPAKLSMSERLDPASINKPPDEVVKSFFDHLENRKSTERANEQIGEVFNTFTKIAGDKDSGEVEIGADQAVRVYGIQGAGIEKGGFDVNKHISVDIDDHGTIRHLELDKAAGTDQWNIRFGKQEKDAQAAVTSAYKDVDIKDGKIPDWGVVIELGDKLEAAEKAEKDIDGMFSTLVELSHGSTNRTLKDAEDGPVIDIIGLDREGKHVRVEVRAAGDVAYDVDLDKVDGHWKIGFSKFERSVEGRLISEGMTPVLAGNRADLGTLDIPGVIPEMTTNVLRYVEDKKNMREARPVTVRPEDKRAAPFGMDASNDFENVPMPVDQVTQVPAAPVAVENASAGAAIPVVAETITAAPTALDELAAIPVEVQEEEKKEEVAAEIVAAVPVEAEEAPAPEAAVSQTEGVIIKGPDEDHLTEIEVTGGDEKSLRRAAFLYVRNLGAQLKIPPARNIIVAFNKILDAESEKYRKLISGAPVSASSSA